MLSYVIGALITCFLGIFHPIHSGPIDAALNWARADRIPIEVNLPWLPFENETRCYGDIGCLNITREWYHLIHRPFNVFPLARNVINTRFILYTEKNPTDGQILEADNKEQILESNFNSKWMTKFIIHGFIDTPLSNWVSDMRDELIIRGGLNVIVVDWAGGSLPLYTQATANTRLVGLEIAHLIKKLQDDHDLRPEDVHLIGHSLGAHTAGYAAERIPGIGRITGLDPAEPYFQGMGSAIRLDPSDATFVDVIHTDGRSFFLLEIPGYGMSQSCGHIDFYPNNGKEQPGCALSQEGGTLIPLTLIKDGIEEASRVLLACNHVRAIKLFIDSINGKCPYVAHRCPSYMHFMAGRCFKCTSNNCAVMGYHATIPQVASSNSSENEINSETSDIITPPQPGKYFLVTGKDFPFCRKPLLIKKDLERVSRQLFVATIVRGFNLRGFKTLTTKKEYIYPFKNIHEELCPRTTVVTNNCRHEQLYPGTTVVQSLERIVCILISVVRPLDPRYIKKRERHYRFTIELAKPRVAESYVQGYLTAGIFSDRGALRGIDLTPKGTVRLEHGTTYQIVVTNPHDLGDRIRKVELNWAHEMNVLEPRTLCLFWCNDHLYVKSLVVETMQMPSREKRNTEFSNKLCSPKREYADIANRGSSVFYDNCKKST